MIILKKETERPQSIFTTHYNYTFQVYRFEKQHKGHPNLSKETSCLFGIGFSATSQRRYSKRDANYLNLS
jgi:hypothetical protein